MVSRLTKTKKQESVARISKALGQYPIIAVASLQALPGKQYSLIRKKLRGQAVMLTARNTLLQRALKEGNPKAAASLEAVVQGPTALILTTLDPFKLYRIIRESKGKAAAKPGAIAPEDIIIPAGETNLPPGPILTELKQAKIDARIQGPKVVIGKDSLVAKKGEPIPEAVTKVLVKLGIEPMEIGLKVQAVWQDGVVYPSDVLNVEPAQYLAWVKQAASQALNLSVFAGIYNAASVPLLITKAAKEARGLALEAGLMEKEIMPELLGRAQRAAKALSAKVPAAPSS